MAEVILKKRMAQEISELKNELNWKTVLVKFKRMFVESHFTPKVKGEEDWDYEWLSQVEMAILAQDMEAVQLHLARINETYIFEFTYTAFKSCPALFEELKNEYDLQAEVVTELNSLYGSDHASYADCLDGKPLAMRERVKQIRRQVIRRNGVLP